MLIVKWKKYLRAVPFVIWGGRNEVQFDPLLPPTYIFFDPQLTPYNIFLTKMLYGGVHARLYMKNLYGGGVHARFFMYARQGGAYNIFTSSQGGIQHFFYVLRGAYNIFIPQRILQHFRFQRGAQHFVCVRDSRCLLRPTLVPDHNIVSTLTVTLLVGSISDLSFAMLFLNPQTSNII